MDRDGGDGAFHVRAHYGKRLQHYRFQPYEGKALPLIEKGAAWVDSPREATEKSDVIFTMLGFPEDVRAVILEKEAFSRRPARVSFSLI